uniref:Dedicator of cytokinesis protein 1 n=1 Tax=Strigamia maritima TaxID=126957 RepID=T1IIV8_STRMM
MWHRWWLVGGGIEIIFTFKSDTKDYFLELNLGDTVHILEEIKDWYYGYCTRTRHNKGIFPKKYIHIKEAVIDKTGPFEEVIPKEIPIIQEITTTLREWLVIWKQLYLRSGENFDKIRGMMYELIEYRRLILTGALPVDELKELKHKITTIIDIGNSILDLDLVVRDDQGNILNPDETSTIHLYRQHELATQRLHRSVIYQTLKTTTRYCHSLYVTLKNFVCKIGDDADLLMTLYDAKEMNFISEHYVVKWAKEGLARDLDQLNNLRVLFTDLGTNDLLREKVFLICQIVRIGAMELKDVDHRRMTYTPKKSVDELRRPFGIAGENDHFKSLQTFIFHVIISILTLAKDVSDIVSGKLESDEEKQHFIPFIQCGDREFLESVIRKAISSKEVSQKEHKGQGLWISVKLLHGDLKQVREENPHLVSVATAIARKMGFPEIILPGDVRNDLYLTLVQGEFPKGNKSSDKNVEVSVRVFNEKGQILKSYISIGAGVESLNEYRSVIYYHEDKPKWFETLKVTIPIEEFDSAHIKFNFRHRSSNDVKDKSEKPFAVSFVKLRQENGTTLKNESHNLLVYKVDHKKYSDTDVHYLTLPSTRQELESLKSEGANHSKHTIHSGGLSLTIKDSFQISTLICSTKLTQNIDLLGLLKWADCQDGLKENLLSLMNVDGEEVVKFLQDVLDALFNILMLNNDSDLYDNLVFEALVFIIGLISDRKYQHFKPVLDVYIKETFSATLAYNKLMVVLKYLVDNANVSEGQDNLLRTMKSLHYIFKFIIRSRILFSQLNEGKGRQHFESSLQQLLNSFTGMMLYTSGMTLLVQGACLKYFPTTITDILSVFDSKELSGIVVHLINNVPIDRLTKQKMMCVNDIVFSSRRVMLQVFCLHIKYLLEREEEVELCVKILSDILEVLYNDDVGQIVDDISEILATIFRTITQTVIRMDKSSFSVGNFVAIMITILRETTPYHYKQYIQMFTHRSDTLDFITEIVLIFKDLVRRNVYPPDWCQMIMLQNSVILKALRYFSDTIRSTFSDPFEYQIWSNFFYCAISFITQDALQLENFSQTKRNKIICRYKDMRREAGFEIRSMWFSLGQHKIQFVPGMVGPFLEMTLVPEVELRKATILIFFDMMQCEFYSRRSSVVSECNHVKEIKGNFNEFENEMVTQLDVLIEGGRGNEQYKDLFSKILSELCENHSTMREEGLRFVKTVTRLIERLLEYRAIVTDENKENRMSCTVNLLEFYNEINRKEMYIRYLYKLSDLHLECDNYTEAAFTLNLHAKLLKWSNESLQLILKNDKHPNCGTHHELKEALYYDMIDYFDKGKVMWELALILCKELSEQYENEIFDYTQLSSLLKRMSILYDNIMKQMRPEAEYFRVAYYGMGFPTFLQNKVFIYRGKEYERLSDFSSHLQNQFPNAKLLTKLAPPDNEILTSCVQYLQINKVDPLMQEKKKFSNKSVQQQILKFYKVNDVQKFTYSRRKGGRDSDNEFANLWLERTVLEISYPLPGILRWFPAVTSHSFDVSPLENAVETMELSNKKLQDLIVTHDNDTNSPLGPLSMMLSGIVDAAVMGGIVNYEKAFFTDEFLEKNPTRKNNERIQWLKDLIAQQIPLLEAGLFIHRLKAPESLRPFHERMEECFVKLKAHVEDKYGRKTLTLDEGKFLSTMRRHKILSSKSNIDRLSDGNLSISDILLAASLPSRISPNSRAHSVFVRPASPAVSNKSTRSKRDSAFSTLRRASAASVSSRESEAQSQTQWYDSKTDLQQPIIELNEQLTPHRPLRSETEKRNSRPSSGHFVLPRTTPTPLRTAVSFMPSLSPPMVVNDTPPPLPQKQAYADYSNLGDSISNGNVTRKGSLPLPIKIKKAPFPLPGKERTPPTPPKKPRRPKTVNQ